MRAMQANHLAVLILVIGLTCVTSEAFAQRAEKDVYAVIEQLFDAMRSGDGDVVRATFHDGATIGRAITNGDSTHLRTGPIDPFADAVGRPRDHAWDERIWNVDIHVDGALATAWMEYAFYLDDDLHHCGVNAMQLFRSEAGWKIVHLLDTDRGLDCRWAEDAIESPTE